MPSRLTAIIFLSCPLRHLESSLSAASEIYGRLGRIIYSKAVIRRKVRSLASRICRDFRRQGEVTLISNLKGSFRFLADLCAEMTLPVRVDFMTISAYKGETRPSGPIRVTRDLQLDIRGKDVLLIEDIVDTGETLDRVVKYLRQFKGPRSVRVCALLDKTAARTKKVRVDYRGFVVPDRFIVGYGLDFREYFRELNHIAEYKP